MEQVAISSSRECPNTGIELASPALVSEFFTTMPPGKHPPPPPSEESYLAKPWWYLPVFTFLFALKYPIHFILQYLL